MSDDHQHTRTPGAAQSARQLVGRGLGRCGLYGLALATAGLAACSATASPAPQDLGRPAASSTVGAPAGRAASSPAVPDLTFVYTGHSEEVGVPASATAAYVTVGGGAGWTHSNFDAREPGRGVILTGTLDVTAGDTLTVAVGGQGTEEKTNKRPGVGGWSIPHYAAGSGGSGHGSQTYDGAGGGGASVIQRNGTTDLYEGAGSGRLGLASGVVPAGLTRERHAAAWLASRRFVEPAGATPWSDSTED